MNKHRLSDRPVLQVWAIFLTSITILLFLSFSLHRYRTQASAQEKVGTKVLTIADNPLIDAPLVIEVYLYGKKIHSDKPFVANDNWLEDMQIVVTNKTDDNIKFVSLILDFPTQHNGEPMYKRYRINYGKDEVFQFDGDDTDIEARRIGKKEIAVITFNSNRPDSFEQFKKSAPCDPKTWDKGILCVGTVEFEERMWHMGSDFDKKEDGKWERNKEKEKQLIERIKKSKQDQKEGESKIGFFRNFNGGSRSRKQVGIISEYRVNAVIE